LPITEETRSADPQEEGRAVSESDDNQALNEDELDGVAGGAGEWWEGLSDEIEHNFLS